MEVLKGVCPNCKERLTIKSNISGINDKLIACPKCSFKAIIAVFINGVDSFNNALTDDEPTQVNFDSIGTMDRTIGSLYIGTSEFALKKGRTLVGRLASTSHADLQIPTEDRYMSRAHAYITVKYGMNGLEHLLEPANPKNPIKFNGKTLEKGDVVVLKWGDKLIFGHTEVIFEKPKYNDDNTIFEE